MPLCQENDPQLVANAEYHIKAQEANLKRLQGRLSDIESEYKRIDPDSERGRLLKKAIDDLRLGVYGEKINPSTGKYEQIKEPGDVRLEVMESLYTERPPKLFTYKNEAGEERRASIYGLPTIEEMREAGFKDAAHEMVVRSLSLLATGNASRNPYDYLSIDGLEVKTPLDRLIEHHHIYNNTVLTHEGKVHPVSANFRISEDGQFQLSVVPVYHGYKYKDESRSFEGQMDSVQFICLMDAMHHGDDPIAHLHYYKFDNEDEDFLKEKVKEKAKEAREQAQRSIPRVEKELQTLRARLQDPQKYEQGLLDTKADLEEQAKPYYGTNGRLKSLPKGSDEAKERDALIKKIDQINKDLDKHRRLETLTKENDDLTLKQKDITDKMKAVASSSTIANYRRKLAAGESLTPSQKDKFDQYMALYDIKSVVSQELQKNSEALTKEGSLPDTIKSKERQLRDLNVLSGLTEDVAISVFEQSNGFFSFDKGNVELNAHKSFSPKMNEEITKEVARNAIEYLQQTGENLEKLYKEEYQRNLINRLGALMVKLK